MEKWNRNETFHADSNNARRSLPPLVVSRAKSAGAAGEIWLANLDRMISEVEKMWNISVGEALYGGTHAFVAYADGRNGEKYALKVDLPENLGGEFADSIAVLEMADGHGYAKLYAYDLERKACLLERLGKPVNVLGYSVFEQLRLICCALQKAWKIPAVNTGFSGGRESVAWFRQFIRETWEKLEQPCSRRVIEQAFSYLQSREDAMNPAEFVLLHGDAHGGNTLKELSGDGCKLIDPDGIIYEKAYDLGVLMREWVEEYEQDPLKNGKERCGYLSRLTGVPEKAIWEWGYLQTVSTAFVLLQIGQEETGRKMLHVAECWSGAAETDGTRKPDYEEDLIGFLFLEYRLTVYGIAPAQRGFYGETWKVHTDKGDCFVKIDYWKHHRESYQNSLSVVQAMSDSGISFIPKVMKTKEGHLYSRFQTGVAAVFEYINGELLEDCPITLLYGHLAEIYRLKVGSGGLVTENFGTQTAGAIQNLRNMPDLPVNVAEALDKKASAISRYAQRLEYFSSVCKKDRNHFHITHGDAGGNCILSGEQIYIVDWDSVMFAPIERDAWIFIGSRQQLDKINSVLEEKGVAYTLEQERLCYYCYAFFFYYLDEFQKSLADAGDEKQKEKIADSLAGYLTDSWIYKRLNAADKVH